jgi:anti-anti-sigma factor
MPLSRRTTVSTLSPVNALTQLHIDTSYPSPATAQVAVSGEVDLATAEVLRDRLLGVLRDEAPTMLGVDLAGVTFLDCTGISALVAVRNAAVRAGRQIRVTHAQPIVRRVLDLTGLLDGITAPIDQPEPVVRDLIARPGADSVSAAAARLPDVMAAA